MKIAFSRSKWPVLIGGLFVIPSLYFIVAALLYYQAGIGSLWQVVSETIEEPDNGNGTFNTNMLLVFRPVLAILINLHKVFSFEILTGEEQMHFNASINKYSFSWMIIFAALFCISAMAIYLLTQKCHC